ncbi:MAG: AAA family ATPase, partial [Nitrososphaerota archaeon]
LDKDVNLEELAGITEGYTGADIEAVVREAAMTAARENINTQTVSMRHFEKALAKVKASVGAEEKAEYDRIVSNFRKSMAYIG